METRFPVPHKSMIVRSRPKREPRRRHQKASREARPAIAQRLRKQSPNPPAVPAMERIAIAATGADAAGGAAVAGTDEVTDAAMDETRGEVTGAATAAIGASTAGPSSAMRVL